MLSKMNFQESIATCFAKYASFSGKASRREFWWFLLFCVLAAALFAAADHEAVGVVFLVTFVPILAAGSRRLHSSGRTGWWQLLYLLPWVGWAVLVFLLAKPEQGDAESQSL